MPRAAESDEKVDVKFPKWSHVKVQSTVNGVARKGAFAKSANMTWLATPYANGSDVFVYQGEDVIPAAWAPARVVASRVDDDSELQYDVLERGEKKTYSYTQVAPAKLADLMATEWNELRDNKTVHVEHNGQPVLHLDQTLEIEEDLYGFVGVVPVVRHVLTADGMLPQHPWLTLFEVNPNEEILVGDKLKIDPHAHPFTNALYYSPGFVGAGDARTEGRDSVKGALQFAAGSCQRFLDQNPDIASRIPKMADMNAAIFAQKKVPAADGAEPTVTYDRAKIVAYNVVKNKFSIRFATALKKQDGSEDWTLTGPDVEIENTEASFCPAIWRSESGQVRPIVPLKLWQETQEYEVRLLGVDATKEADVVRVKKAEVTTVPNLHIAQEHQRLSHNCTIA